MTKRHGFFALKAALSAGLIWLLLSRIKIASVGDRLVQLAPAAIAAAIAALLVQSLLATIRWRVVSRRVGVPLRFGIALRLLFIGLFFNQALISSIGGDAVRVWLLRSLSDNIGRAIRSVVIDRPVALAALFVAIAAALPYLFDLIASPTARSGLVLLLVAGGGGFIILLGFDRLALLPQRWCVSTALYGFTADCRRVFLEPGTLGPTLALSIVIHVLSGLAAYAVARGVGVDISVAQMVVLIPPVILVATLPISVAGWGVREGAMVAALGFVGVSAGDAFTISVIFGFALVVIALPGGLLWLLGLRRGGQVVIPQTGVKPDLPTSAQ